MVANDPPAFQSAAGDLSAPACARQVGSCKLRPDPLFVPFVYHEGVEPTNNLAERALREYVVQRKIIGTFRNEKGTSIHETIRRCSQRGNSVGSIHQKC